MKSLKQELLLNATHRDSNASSFNKIRLLPEASSLGPVRQLMVIRTEAPATIFATPSLVQAF